MEAGVVLEKFSYIVIFHTPRRKQKKTVYEVLAPDKWEAWRKADEKWGDSDYVSHQICLKSEINKLELAKWDVIVV